MKKILVLLLALLWAIPAAAQVYPQVQLAPTPAVTVQVAGSAATPLVNTQYTITLTPPVGQYVYVLGMEWQACQDATSTVQTNAIFTTTGFGSSLPTNAFSLAATVNICANGQWPSQAPYGLKSKTAGVAVTFVTPAAALHVAYNQNVFYYFAP
jgi:hypothetical protein